jgi:predicted nicotinamide N-methyase
LASSSGSPSSPAHRSRTALAEPAPFGWELVPATVDLPDGQLRLSQPIDGAEIPDDGPVEWAPLAPYWSIIWRSGVALAREVSRAPLDGLRVVELGCGLGVPSLAAARAGAEALATDSDAEALDLVLRNARANGLELETTPVEWAAPDELIERAPFDLVLAADVLYERPGVAALLSLLPQLAPEVWIADPNRPAAEAFFEQAGRQWSVESSERGVITIHRLRRLDAVALRGTASPS